MGNKKLFKASSVIAFSFVAMTLAFAFNNCGKVQSHAVEPSQLDSYASKEANLTVQYQGKLAADFCESSQNYACVHKVFSRNLDYASLGSSNSDCVKLLQGGEICPEIQHFTYNSKSAEDESCKENCQESYEFEDFDCHLKLSSSSGVYSLVVSENSLSSALEQLHRSCLNIQQGSH